MLCQFTFKNFKSYRDETTLDFQAAPIKEFSGSLLRTEGASGAFLPVAAIYGPNGGGKSGVLEALQAVVRLVIAPTVLMDAEAGFSMSMPKIVPFKFDGLSKGEPTEFELFFRVGWYEYRYRVSCKSGAVLEESLYRRSLSGTKPAMAFERNEDGIRVGSVLTGARILKETSISERMPLLSFLSINYDIPVVEEVIGWFMSTSFVRSGGMLTSGPRLDWTAMDEMKANIEQLLGNMDLGITSYRIERHDRHPHADSSKLFLQHPVGENTYELESREESAGTQRLLELLPHLLSSLQEGTLLVVDELDDRLHPKMLRQIVSFYKDPEVNVGGGQLLFTSHDVCTMRNTVFRRDEIWFAAKDETESSMLYSLYEIRDENGGAVKATAAYDKQYLEGRYGADPYFERMKGWSGDVE